MQSEKLFPIQLCFIMIGMGKKRRSMFIAVLFIITKIWKQPKCSSVDEWIKMLWYISK